MRLSLPSNKFRHILFAALVLCILTYSNAFSYSFKWQNTIYSASTERSSASIVDPETLSDGTIIVAASRGDYTGKILAYTPNGVLRWTYNIDGNPMGMKVSFADNRIYFTVSKKTTSDGTDLYSTSICGLDTNGSKVWEDEIYSAGADFTYADINSVTLSDGAIVVSANNRDKFSGKIVTYTPNGVLKWSYNTAGFPNVKVSVAENRIYFTTQKKTTTSGTDYYSSNIYGLDTSGNKIWEDEIWPSSTEGNAASVNSEKLADGAIVVEASKGDNAGKIMSYTPNGVLRWSYSHEGRSFLGSSLLVPCNFYKFG